MQQGSGSDPPAGSDANAQQQPPPPQQSSVDRSQGFVSPAQLSSHATSSVTAMQRLAQSDSRAAAAADADVGDEPRLVARPLTLQIAGRSIRAASDNTATAAEPIPSSEPAAAPALQLPAPATSLATEGRSAGANATLGLAAHHVHRSPSSTPGHSPAHSRRLSLQAKIAAQAASSAGAPATMENNTPHLLVSHSPAQRSLSRSTSRLRHMERQMAKLSEQERAEADRLEKQRIARLEMDRIAELQTGRLASASTHAPLLPAGVPTSSPSVAAATAAAAPPGTTTVSRLTQHSESSDTTDSSTSKQQAAQKAALIALYGNPKKPAHTGASMGSLVSATSDGSVLGDLVSPVGDREARGHPADIELMELGLANQPRSSGSAAMRADGAALRSPHAPLDDSLELARRSPLADPEVPAITKADPYQPINALVPIATAGGGGGSSDVHTVSANGPDNKDSLSNEAELARRRLEKQVNRPSHTRRALLIFIAVAMAVVAVTAGLSFRQIANLKGAVDEFRHSEQVSNYTNALLIGLLNGETGTRGYVLSGQDAYLEPYNLSLWQVPLYRNLLGDVLYSGNDLSHVQDLPVLDVLLANITHQWAQTIEDRAVQPDSVGFGLALQDTLTQTGKTLMDDIRAILLVIRRTEAERVDKNYKDSQTALQFMIITTAISVACIALTVCCGGLISLDVESKGLRQHNEQLTALLMKAEEATKLKSVFLANMSHEIRTPMNGVLAMTRYLCSMEELSEEQQEVLDTVLTSAESMMRLIDDLLLFSKMEAGKFQLCPVNFKLASLIKPLNDMFSIRCAAKVPQLTPAELAALGGRAPAPVRWVMHLDENLPRKIYADNDRLRQILTNLLDNAVKFTNQGHVTFSVKLVNPNSTRAKAPPTAKADLNQTKAGIFQRKPPTAPKGQGGDTSESKRTSKEMQTLLFHNNHSARAGQRTPPVQSDLGAIGKKAVLRPAGGASGNTGGTVASGMRGGVHQTPSQTFDGRLSTEATPAQSPDLVGRKLGARAGASDATSPGGVPTCRANVFPALGEHKESHPHALQNRPSGLGYSGIGSGGGGEKPKPLVPSNIPTQFVYLRFAVQDSGIGIDPSVHKAIFEPFQQADMSTTRNFGGTGLGLSICSQLVAQMGGRLKIHSALGQGATFYFTLKVPVLIDSAGDEESRAAADLEAEEDGVDERSDEDDHEYDEAEEEFRRNRDAKALALAAELDGGRKSAPPESVGAALSTDRDSDDLHIRFHTEEEPPDAGDAAKLTVTAATEGPVVMGPFAGSDSSGALRAIHASTDLSPLPLPLSSAHRHLLSSPDGSGSAHSSSSGGGVSSSRSPLLRATQPASAPPAMLGLSPSMSPLCSAASSSPPPHSASHASVSSAAGAAVGPSEASSASNRRSTRGALRPSAASTSSTPGGGVTTVTPPGPPMHILIAEDNAINVKVLTKLLTREGHTVAVANNGKEALDLYRADPAKYQLIMMDLHMPVMDGLVATTEIRSTEKEWNHRDAAFNAVSQGALGGSSAAASSAVASLGGSALASSPQSALTAKTSSVVSGNGTVTRSSLSPQPGSTPAAHTSDGVALPPLHDSNARFLPPPHSSPGSAVSASPPVSATATPTPTPLAAAVAASSAPSSSPAGPASSLEDSSPSQSLGDATTNSAGNTVGGGTPAGGRDSSVRASGGVGGKSKNSKGSRNRESTSSTGSRSQQAKLWHIPIIACTASAMDTDAEICKNVGMDDVLTKPVSINELKAKLRTVSLRWQLARKTPPQSQASSVAPAQHTTTINSSVTAASAASGSGPHMVVSPLGAPITAPKQA